MPQIALISDIHGNIDALEAVLNDIKGQEVDEIVCLGDIVGYGGAPAECLKLVRERCSTTVMGNHDEYLAKGLENFVLSRRIADPLRHAMKSLGSEEMEWLRSLPYTAGVHEFTVTHASLAIAPEAFNFTKSAEEGNAENLLVINNAPELAARYTSNWKEHLGHSEPYQARN